MVMPLGTVKWKCTDCKWSKVVNQKSDVIIKPHCPKCGSDNIKLSKPSLMDQFISIAKA